MAKYNIYNFDKCDFLGKIEKKTFETLKNSDGKTETYEEWRNRIFNEVERNITLEKEVYEKRYFNKLKLIFVDPINTFNS